MKLKDLASVIGDSTLNTVVMLAIRRASISILINPASLPPAIAWATKACFTYKDDRAQFYAQVVIMGALVEDAGIQAAVAAALTNQADLDIPDATLIAVVQTWVARFVQLGI